MKGNLHEAVKKAHGVGLPIIPYAEGKVPGTGLSIAVSEYMQGVSNPQMPMEACADCGHTTCPPDCPCDAVDCPGRANARMSGATPIGGMAHEVTEDEKSHARRMKAKGYIYVILLPKGQGKPLYTRDINYAKEMAKFYGRGTRAMDIDKYLGEVTEGTVVEIDGDKITVWKDDKPTDEAKSTMASKYLQQKVNFGGEIMPLGKVIKTLQKQGTSQKYIDRYVQGLLRGKKVRGEAGPIRNAVTRTQNLLKGGGVDEATKELKSGLGKWLEMARAAKRVGNDKRAVAIMSAIQKVIADKDLDEHTVYNWNETFNGALAPGYNRSDFSESINDRNLFKAVFLAGGPGSGKCLAAGTPVLLVDGSTRAVEDIKVGDQVMGDDSTPRTVTLTHWGRAPMFKITPTKGEPHTVSLGHIMCLKVPVRVKKDGKDTTRGSRIEHVSVQEYLNKSVRYHEKSKLYRVAVEFPVQEVPLDPYFLGVWLGDGDQHRAGVTTEDEEIVAIAAEQAVAHGLQLRPCKDYGYQGKAKQYHLTSGRDGKHFNPIMDKLKSLGILNNKRIPMVYKANSREVRLQVLGGLTDTDGYADPATGHCEITQKRKSLAEDIVFLARSLGFAAYMHEKTVVCQDYVGTAYRIGISGYLDQIPTQLRKKKFRARRQIKDVLHTGFRVEAVGYGKYYGIELEGNHRHLLGDFTVTHNSFIAGGMFKGTGARFVNSDIFFEHLLKKKGLPFEINKSKKIMYGKQMVQRDIAKKLATTQAGNWINGMLPLVIDGTGRDIGKIKKQRKTLEDLGYDTSMVFVNTTLDVAIQRNKQRKRSVPEEFVKKGWQSVQKNIGAFQSLFSGNLMVVDNSAEVSGAGLSDLKVRLARGAMKMLGGSLKNRMGQNTVAALQRSGGKYISDLEPEVTKKGRPELGI